MYRFRQFLLLSARTVFPSPCSCEDVVEIRMARLPAQSHHETLWARTENGRIAGTTCAVPDWDLLADHLLGPGVYLAYRVTRSKADVIRGESRCVHRFQS